MDTLLEPPNKNSPQCPYATYINNAIFHIIMYVMASELPLDFALGSPFTNPTIAPIAQNLIVDSLGVHGLSSRFVRAGFLVTQDSLPSLRELTLLQISQLSSNHKGFPGLTENDQMDSPSYHGLTADPWFGMLFAGTHLPLHASTYHLCLLS